MTVEGWSLEGTVDGPTVARWAAVGGTVAVVPVVAWAFAVGGKASGAAGAVALIGVAIGLGGCVVGLHHGPPAAGVAFAAALLAALAGAETSGVRLDAGPVAAFAVVGTELWGWSLDHRADMVERAAVRRRMRTVALVAALGIGGSLAVPLLAGSGVGDLTMRALAVSICVAAVALLVRNLRPIAGGAAAGRRTDR